MRDAVPQTIQLKDYAPPAFRISQVALDVDIDEGRATVHATLHVQRNREGREPLILDGEDLELLAVRIDGRTLQPTAYRADESHLVIAEVPDAFTLETIVRFDPWRNTKLEGLYATASGLVTQCEAQGFRHITYFIDRPDVMAKYIVTICAEKTRFPYLLANGNLVESGAGVPGEWFAGNAGAGRHWARWEDPFPKPCYLFAMVAADLDLLEDHFVTRSGKRALLQIYVERGKLDQAGFAMQSLQRCMRWDEEVFGLELDLERFMIVAVPDFNAGAMENKGLNIFNTKYILARADTATDGDYFGVDKVVAHEYFHNWTGNRVTCRDWFQLSLKEGLTVYRDQRYSRDMYSEPVVRIQEVRSLRERQFSEDAGPMAHAVRPDSYVEVNNFYTATVYDKGAEVVGMYATILGRDGFRRGMDLYFQRHDGQAVTCDDFRTAMADANGADLAQFERWYSQAGTPVVECKGVYDAAARTYTLELSQSCPATPGQPEKEPFVVPFAAGLVGRAGDLPLHTRDPLFGEVRDGTAVLALAQARQRFVFTDVRERPVPSLLRGFSAPVHVRFEYSDEDLRHLMTRDSDAFNRWEAAQSLASRILVEAAAEISAGRAARYPDSFVASVKQLLADAAKDPAFAAECLQLPAESYIAESMDVADPSAIYLARLGLMRHIASRLRPELERAIEAFAVPGAYSPDAEATGRRALRSVALMYVASIDDDAARGLALREFEAAHNMTDSMSALMCLANSEGPQREDALARFERRWRDEALVMDKWFRVQALSRAPDTLMRVESLVKHAAFDLRNPNRARAVLHTFAIENPLHFHAADGSGYRWIARQLIALDRLNPQVAARLARAFDRWKKYDAGRQAHARAALQSIRAAEGLSSNVGEVVDRALA